MKHQIERRAKPFASYEWLVAWRYLRSRRDEGGVSMMTLISLLGIAVAVFALVATLSIRTGYRSEFVATILGANPHASVLSHAYRGPDGRISDRLTDYERISSEFSSIVGVVRTAPVVKAQLLAQSALRNTGVELVGIALEDLRQVPLVAEPEIRSGSLENFGAGVSLGSGVARSLGVGVGDRINLVAPEGAKTALGISPRIKSYEVVYVFGVGRYDIDSVRVYLPFAEAQMLLNREGNADEIEVYLADPQQVEEFALAAASLTGSNLLIWTWKDSSGAFLEALRMEDNVMFVIMSILVLVAASNIVSGLVMLAKNKGRDIGILRTIGLSQGAILRIFFICGATTGVIGTAIGIVAGCLFAVYIDPIFDLVNMIAGGGVWDPSVRFLSRLPAELRLEDIFAATALSLGLSFCATFLPARRAAKMNPVEALRYE